MGPVEIQVLTKCPQCGEKLTLEMYSISGEPEEWRDLRVLVYHCYKCEAHGTFELVRSAD
jgi:hypothetical protein